MEFYKPLTFECDQWAGEITNLYKKFKQNYRFLYHGDQKISWWRMCR